MFKKLISLLLILLTCLASNATILNPTTTLNNETSNNTSASPNCTIYNDTRSGIKTTNGYPCGGNVSGIDAHPLVYTGFNGDILVHIVPWFSLTDSCGTSNGGSGGWSLSRHTCRSHVDNGYDYLISQSNRTPNTAQIHAQVNDIIRRGFQGIVWLWEGYQVGGVHQQEDIALDGLRQDLEARCNPTCPLKFTIMLDSWPFGNAATFRGTSPPGTNISVSGDETAILDWLQDNICYLNQHYFGSSAYYKVNGGPLWSTFVNESGRTNAGAPSWKDLWITMAGTSFGSASPNNLKTACSTIYPGTYPAANEPDTGPLQISLGNQGAYGHDGMQPGPASSTVGYQNAFEWEWLGGTLGVSGQDSNITNALADLDFYYGSAINAAAPTHNGAAWPGFDDQLAGWSPNNGCSAGSYCTAAGRVTNRACGVTWFNSLHRAATDGFSSGGTHLARLQVVTWNDYDEDTAIEMGIDNCYRISASLSSSVVNWSLTTTSNEANAETIDHFTVFASTDGTNLGIVADNLPNNTTSFDLSTLGLAQGVYTIYVKMQGINSVINRFATAPGSFTVVNAPPPPPPPGNPPPTPPPAPPPGNIPPRPPNAVGGMAIIGG